MNPHDTDRPDLPELGDDRVAAMRAAIDGRLDADDRERSRRRRTVLLAAAAAVVVGTSTGLAVDVLPSTSARDGEGVTAVTAGGYSYEAAPPSTSAELEAQAHVDARPDPDFFPDGWAVSLSEVAASGNAYLDVPDAEAAAEDLRSWMSSADGRVELTSVTQDGDDTTALLRLRFPVGELATVSTHLGSLDDDSLVRVTQRPTKTDRGARDDSLSALTPTAGRVSDAVLYVVLSTPREPEEPQQEAFERGSDAVAAALPWVGGALVGAVGVLWARRPRARRS